MTKDEGTKSADLGVSLDVPAEFDRGEFIYGVVRVENRGEGSVEVSGRLNLFEGDVRVRLTGPDEKPRRIHGAYQVDSPPRRVSLEPGHAIEAGVFLFFTSAGLTFAEEGEYRLQLEYDPSVRLPTLVADERRLVVHAPADATHRALAEVTLKKDVGRAIALLEAPPASQARSALEELVKSYRKLREGRVAALVMASQDDPRDSDNMPAADAAAGWDPMELAHWTSALATPASAHAAALKKVAAAVLKRSDASGRNRSRAEAIASGQPYPLK